jgi:hypothetical protein
MLCLSHYPRNPPPPVHTGSPRSTSSGCTCGLLRPPPHWGPAASMENRRRGASPHLYLPFPSALLGRQWPWTWVSSQSLRPDPPMMLHLSPPPGQTLTLPPLCPRPPDPPRGERREVWRANRDWKGHLLSPAPPPVRVTMELGNAISRHVCLHSAAQTIGSPGWPPPPRASAAACWSSPWDATPAWEKELYEQVKVIILC